MGCKQNNRTKPIRFSFAHGSVGLVLLLILCLISLCGCYGTDKYVEIIVAGSDVVITPVPGAVNAADSAVKTVKSCADYNFIVIHFKPLFRIVLACSISQQNLHKFGIAFDRADFCRNLAVIWICPCNRHLTGSQTQL